MNSSKRTYSIPAIAVFVIDNEQLLQSSATIEKLQKEDFNWDETPTKQSSGELFDYTYDENETDY